MASFGKLKTQGNRPNIARFKFAEGLNDFRIVGPVLPRYVYWIKNPETGNDTPFECLSFNRDTEEFTSDPDPVAQVFSDLKPKWSYVVKVFNYKTGNVEVMDLKKGMLGDMVEHFIDLELPEGTGPEDFEVGIDWIVERKFVGPKTFNVDYKVKSLKSKSKPASTELREKVAAAKTIEEDFVKETAESQTARLAKLMGEEVDNVNTDSVNDLD
jgi:hypothetical protein